jgi:hypothetical protein
MDYDLLDDGTKIAKKDSKTNRWTWQMALHTALNHLQAILAALTGGGVTGALVTPAGVVATVKYLNTTVAAAQTDSQLVALVAAKKIRVLALHLDCAGTATVATLQSNATAKAGPFNNAASEQTVLPYNPHGWFETAAGQALKITTGAGATTSVTLVYVEV